MKPSVFSKLASYAQIVKINTINTWQTETAYFGNNWGNVLSTITFTLTYIVFISVLFANVRTFAGYDRDQILFLSFLGQINFYLMFVVTFPNLSRLSDDVNGGNFDLLLTKPLPSLFYSSLRSIGIIGLLRDGIPSLFFLSLAINWTHIHVSLLGLAAGAAIVFLGQLAINSFCLLLTLPVFRTGQATESLGLGYMLFSANEIPYEGVPDKIRVGLTFLVPILLPASLATSVILGKTSAVAGLAIALFVATILTGIKIWGWKRALASYTSASS